MYDLPVMSISSRGLGVLAAEGPDRLVRAGQVGAVHAEAGSRPHATSLGTCHTVMPEPNTTSAQEVDLLTPAVFAFR